jgi:hypothetical protein
LRYWLPECPTGSVADILPATRLGPLCANSRHPHLEIAPSLIEAHGYPELTPSLKQKVFRLTFLRRVPEAPRENNASIASHLFLEGKLGARE